LKELVDLLRVKLTPLAPYHPQTDGQTEQVNQEIEAYLQVFVNHRQDDWADWLPLAEFTYNNHIHSSTCQTPFELNTSQHPRMGTEPMCTSKVEAANAFSSRMMKMQEEAKAALEHAADEMACYYNHNHEMAPTYQEGDQVWLSTQNYMTDRPTKKLDHKWIGPFKVIKVISPAAIKLQLTVRQKGIHPIVSVTNVRPHHPDEIAEHPADPCPGPELIDGEEEYEVEKVLDSKWLHQKLWYLVKFVGWPNSENQWPLHEHLTHASDRVKEFHQMHPCTPGRERENHLAASRRSGLRRG